MLPRILFEIFLTSAVICKQRLFEQKRDCSVSLKLEYLDVNQDHFRKPLEVFTNAMKNNCPYDNPCIFQGPFNFKLLFTFKLL